MIFLSQHAIVWVMNRRMPSPVVCRKQLGDSENPSHSAEQNMPLHLHLNVVWELEVSVEARCVHIFVKQGLKVAQGHPSGGKGLVMI